MERNKLFSIFIAILFLGSSAAFAINFAMPSKNVKSAEPTQNTEGPDFTGEIRDFQITAKKFEFNPKEIVVNKGDLVRLHVTSMDVIHGFTIDEYGINKRLTPGQTVDIEFVADEAGNFTYYSSIYAGENTTQMRGTLVVKEVNE